MRRTLPRQVAECLRICAVGILAHGDVQLAIRSKMDCAAIVIRGARQIVELENDHFAAGHGHVAIRGEAADAIVPRRAGTV